VERGWLVIAMLASLTLRKVEGRQPAVAGWTAVGPERFTPAQVLRSPVDQRFRS